MADPTARGHEDTNFVMTARYPRDQAVDKTTTYNMGGSVGGSYGALVGKVQPAHMGSQSMAPDKEQSDTGND